MQALTLPAAPLLAGLTLTDDFDLVLVLINKNQKHSSLIFHW